MRCPFCQHTDSRVLESRSAEAGQSVRRRRECLQCKRRFTTYERIELVAITVLKRDGQRESFDRSKLLRGVVRSCEKTGIDLATLERLVDRIETNLQQRTQREVSSCEIGEQVLRHLRPLSEVAYIRFASVYGKFQGIRDFVETLNHLQSHPIAEQAAPKSDGTEPENSISSPDPQSDRQWVCTPLDYV
ncbi:transcriptional regulator NrdR [Roseofilum capinflatum]|uniref:Transcriptional repressor NrdR n=1 Tax=Roseofilum capinflatum BLCC-M114 TaxID=3022440 RepID=A0ABT7B752_9CYAN|nr:transcriptional regulator NrdR [Roseofilum capinflatum]MDJ1174993.1 transcriptional regulator NrdR [Roseofilum capinflatum BLCC-M114]